MSVNTFLDGRVALHAGDCLDRIREIPDASIDSVVTDPPYALVSITKRFGKLGSAPCVVPEGRSGAYARASAGFMGKAWDVGDRAFAVEFWAEVFRVLKPGGHVLAFGGTRTVHRLVCAIEDAGFEIRDQVGWAFGSGFPKSHNAGNGWGTALKPAWEPITMARKPLDGTVVANVLKHGTGALNIDGCRVPMSSEDSAYISERIGGFNATQSIGGSTALGGGQVMDRSAAYDPSKGRFPANLIHDGSDEVIAAFPDAPGQQRSVGPEHGVKSSVNVFGDYGPRDHFGPRGDAGSAARFFYNAKADSDDRIGSKHPTVKPVDLMRYLVRLVTPPGGTVLDPFAGTGTTGEAAYREGFSAVMIEREEEYRADIARRMALILAGPDERKREIIKAKGKPVDLTGTLFADPTLMAAE